MIGPKKDTKGVIRIMQYILYWKHIV